MSSFENRVVIISGAGRGIGKAMALGFAKKGARVFIPDISLERAEATVSEIKAMGGQAAACECDISDEKSTLNMADQVLKLFGTADVLINNAAIYYGLNMTPWDLWKTTEWDRIFEVNVRGTWLVCKAVAPIMLKNKKGKIINIASDIAHLPAAAQMLLPYACSKGAVYTLTQALAQALGPSGINVNAIAPGYTASEASLGQKDSVTHFKSTAAGQAIKRREEPQDLVGTALFLASEGSDFLSGQILFVDGGAVML
ncbi:MAG TPA: SDR family oxidoreductase [Dehalococcoidales bacterium]|nr:SDR family oxidoreductase [Dehalococcoidales bacterium]